MSNLEKPRLSRLLAILIMLQSKSLITAQELATRHSVSIRTIYRDIRTLEASGIPIVTEEGRGYSLVDGFIMPPIGFTEDESNALVTAEQMMLLNKDESLVAAFESAMNKVRSVLRIDRKDQADLLSDRVIFRANDQRESSSNIVAQLQNAITHFQVVHIAYTTLEGKDSKRDIEPFALYHTDERWILIAYCRLRTSFRSFRVDLIKNLSLRSEHFPSHNMSLQEYFEKY